MPDMEFSITKEVSIRESIPSLKIAVARKSLAKRDTPINTYDSYKISVIRTEGMSVLYGAHIYRASRGDIMFFHPNELHHARIHREGIHSYMDIYIPTEFFSELSADLSGWEHIFTDTSADRVNFVSLPTKERGELLDIADNCEELILNSPSRCNILLFSNIIRILELASSFYTEQKNCPYRDDTPAAVQAALLYIHKNYKTISGLSEIAGNSGCSVTYLTKTFRIYTGETVNNFMTECRLSHAKTLLAQGASVTQSCYDSGFGDCSHFIKLFKQSEGVTPLAYRKKEYGLLMHSHSGMPKSRVTP